MYFFPVDIMCENQPGQCSPSWWYKRTVFFEIRNVNSFLPLSRNCSFRGFQVALVIRCSPLPPLALATSEWQQALVWSVASLWKELGSIECTYLYSHLFFCDAHITKEITFLVGITIASCFMPVDWIVTSTSKLVALQTGGAMIPIIFIIQLLW